MKSLLFVLSLLTFTTAQDGWFWQNPWPQGQDLFDVAVINEDKIIAVGSGSVIVSSTDGGNTWQVNYYDELNTDFKSIIFLDEYTGWICGTCYSDYQIGVVLKTDDGGDTWSRVELLPNADLQEIQFIDENNGWISGRNTITITPYLFKTDDSGYSWQEEELSSKKVSNCQVRFFDPDTGIISFKDDNWNFGSGEFLKTVDGGTTWDSLHFGFDYVFFANSKHGWATHLRPSWYTPYYSIHSTIDGGKTWIEDTTQYATGEGIIYFTDTLIISNSGAFDFYDNSHGYNVGWSGFISATKDGGRTWLDRSKTVTRYELNSVYFVNEQTGWIVGGELEWVFDLWEERPVVLKTSDGGNNWIKLGHGGYGSLPGYFIYKGVYFLSENIGWILPNRGRIYKTIDGGNQWSIAFDTTSVTINDFYFIDIIRCHIFGDENGVLRTT